ncbi:UDP-N-acetylmuramoyl-tripeptide--D-alanyl-D-alanine ligase [Salisediminibacterium halotolerans]|uniref:UDP-N-acetylmuramoyl-tripeptide--D-alanyl-D- alanine ligase n=1 Tax=Salisediminibacterium halotolerans TaxID=517425 RepID=UPI000EABF920|nr:UDP-N-acetylmuramoyl-tripeptide--D-alanyl-D-alanine ligase [Salisediminibacterium halotolerans]RLJ71665.1 UDP-N-acetylmuramoyl-tripeptide--D-alanyl-D-alanine ligase [Actinophytocola xinjiangensis]RPE86815.1 UDP-N-acetylmuramoyl-tripeptide--D-alanyl-D-alanine ligase [Salisediminibacterium halotolerans]TWG32878.1 UDP-N-acetylmuramoyl-tripeptide--D-alanyl-D-alanine ligase [Salisediminibacterium halotolerans]GEL06970.1 UDP-N-acetylmuramoyl-tripeptide--D-alanyl-D-alanine ligase [Salisediminibacte
MIQRTLKEITMWLTGNDEAKSAQAIKISGVSTDTRTIQPGSLFVPLTGENFNGHQFAETAMENGAVAALWGKHEANPPENLPVIYVEDTLTALQTLAKKYLAELSVNVVGITGSNGKTTTKDMVAAVLGKTYRVQKTEGNYNNHIGLPLTILALREETEIAVLEMGMSARGEIEFLSKLAQPDAAIITNIGESHMEELGSRAGISEAKFEITAGLSPTGTLIIPGEEPLLTEKTAGCSFQVRTFGIEETNDLYPQDVEQRSDGTAFSINGENGSGFFIPILGKHNVQNALSAVAAGEVFAVPREAAKEGLKTLAMTGMRTELVSAKNGLTFINDAYNASPTSMRAVVSLLSDMDGYEQKIVVLADMLELGVNEEAFHIETGEAIDPKQIDYVLTFGELGEKIAEGAKRAFGEERVSAYQDKDHLIADLQKIAAPGDIVLVKGSRGKKLEDVVNAFV